MTTAAQRIDSIRVYAGPSKPKPRAGDRRVTKAHGLQIRVQCMARTFLGHPMARMVSNGRPVFAWRKPRELDPWDHYLLTADERATLNEPAP